MVSIAHLVKRYLDARPFLQEAVSRGIVNFGALAEEMLPFIQQELGKEVKHAAVMMAIRRYGEQVKKQEAWQFNFESEINMKTGLCDIAVVKSNTWPEKMKKIYALVDFEKGDILNIIHGNYEVSIIANEKYLEKIKDILAGEKIIHIEKSLVSVALRYSTDFLYTPGVLFTITRALAWNNINLFEIISTYTELNFIVSKKDAMRTYEVLQEVIEQKQ